MRTCNAQGTGYGWCTGQRVPDEVEWCASPQDENCDGLVNPACAPVTLAAGSAHSLAVRSDGTIWGWGDNGDYQVSVYQNAGVYGDPFFVQELSGVTDVAAGYGHSLALLADGTVRSWGTNYGGQLGTTTAIPDLVVVPGLDQVIDVAAGRYHSMALRSDGTVWTWGDSSSGQLGDGTVGWRATPAGWGTRWRCARTAPPGPGGATAAGSSATRAIRGRSRIPPPVPVLLDQITAIAAGDMYALALRADGTRWAWGDNDSGQLGYHDVGSSVGVPVEVWPHW